MLGTHKLDEEISWIDGFDRNGEKPRLLDQFREVLRYKHYSFCTEDV